MEKMNIINKNIKVTMSRENLEDIPEYPVPIGYSLRRYSPGDEHIWVDIQSAADKYNEISLELFRREFGEDPEPISQRQLYLIESNGKEVGTATAWYDEDFRGKTYGRIHWVAIHPDYQGQGLSKPLMSKACNRLRELGHDRAYLTTSTARIPAINLYIQFGFRPDIQGEDDKQVWRQIKKHLKHG